jgi:alpha-glucosidase
MWWRQAVLYQVYVRSFADSNGDGVGDLPGLIGKLDYLEWLGVDALWLSPTFPSPNADWGYDVADYLDVDPALGTLADLDELVAQARERGMRILLDLVPNHTSDAHAWFADSRSSREAAHRDWYVWRDRPNNWVSVFGGPAWEWDEQTRQHYLHLFHRRQPDLNWDNPRVRDAFDDVLRFWFERGVAGFRIDVANGLAKDPQLRDNPPADDGDRPIEQRMGQKAVYSANRPEVHEIHKRFRCVADGYDERLLLGETLVSLEQTLEYYGDGDELHLAMNFPFANAPLEELPQIVAETERLFPDWAWPVYFGSNHDLRRLASRWACGDERRARGALVALLTLRGTPILYAGDEIALEDAAVPAERRLDPAEPSRDPCRTPLPWTRGGQEWRDPWLPLGSTERNVEDQRADPASTLNLVRELIALRKAFVNEPYEALEAPAGVWRWRRGTTTIEVDLAAGETSVTTA